MRQVIPVGTDCPACGAEMEVETDAVQGGCPEDDDCGHSWHAVEGDPVTCPKCGSKAAIDCDGEGAWVRFDD